MPAPRRGNPAIGGARRPATADELGEARRRVRPMRLTVTGFRLVRYPVMMPEDAPRDREFA
ncbi:hypothetical protein ATM97_31945 [Nocardia sp. MH4]|uniref:hypothetical protein n=1 Tax=Nocardia sp. MH4 TaxID=1768677 RepID=UPI001C4FE7D4|nr:hypothetical protein [Nocardia sp. MH4]MBW0273928.1 hypothetical protein [Nocardia sp. MH4]